MSGGRLVAKNPWGGTIHDHRHRAPRAARGREQVDAVAHVRHLGAGERIHDALRQRHEIAVALRVDEAETAALAAADKARELSAYASLWLFISLLSGAFIASLMAVYGGRQRDLN